MEEVILIEYIPQGRKLERENRGHGCIGGSAVGIGLYTKRDGLSSPYAQSGSWSSPRPRSSISQSSTNTPIPAPSSGSSSISRPPGGAVMPAASCSLRSAAMRSSARGVELGGSSTICSQPTGGEPGGEMRKFFSIAGGRRCAPPGGVTGVGSARNTRRMNAGLWGHRSDQ